MVAFLLSFFTREFLHRLLCEKRQIYNIHLKLFSIQSPSIQRVFFFFFFDGDGETTAPGKEDSSKPSSSDVYERKRRRKWEKNKNNGEEEEDVPSVVTIHVPQQQQ